MDQPKKGSPIFFVRRGSSDGRWRAVLALQLAFSLTRSNAMQRACDHAHANRGNETRTTICAAYSVHTLTTRANSRQEGHIGPLVSRITLTHPPYPVPHALTCKIGIARQLMLSRAHPRLSHCSSNRCRTSCRPSAALRQLELARDAVDPASKTARGKVISAGSRRGSASSIRVPRGRYPSRQRCPGLLRPPCSNARCWSFFRLVQVD